MIFVKELVKKYRERTTEKIAQHLTFTGVDGKDVYNITAPFHLDGKELIAGRVEPRDSEKSCVRLFEKNQETTYDLLTEGIDLTLQDPFVVVINNQVILGGVEVFFEHADSAKWRTVLYELVDESRANKFFEGPLGMKDLRLAQLPNGKILVLTRPQGEKGNRGKIGYTVLNDLNELSIEVINEAPLLNNQFCEEEWGGANEIHLVSDQIFVLGHIACFDEAGNRHYYGFTFEVDLAQGAMKNAQIIVERLDFLVGPAKRKDLYDVVFSGGILLEGKKATLYAGISDAGAQKIRLNNPFISS